MVASLVKEGPDFAREADSNEWPDEVRAKIDEWLESDANPWRETE